MKKCTKCQKEKSFTFFNRNSKSKDGYTSYCKECAVIKSKEWVTANTDKRKKNQSNYYILHERELKEKQNIRRSQVDSKNKTAKYGRLYLLKKED